MRSALILAGALSSVVVGMGTAQSTGMPTFNAPYRAFDHHEFGGVLSFVDGADAGAEGVYRISSGRFDIGFRGGLLLGATANDDALLVLGTELRQRIIEHDERFPADGALVLGVGARLGDFNQLIVPAGLSLGRRLDVEDSEVSIIPFLQPTVFLVAGESGVGLADNGLKFALGLGADFRLTPVFDLRLAGSLGDLEGISFGAVWLR